ncbi:MAG: hypothetical protein KDE19_10320 [Caldilineaceae bacterium]|nr:hypothetical protein [Caldilineaceae bacterium]
MMTTQRLTCPIDNPIRLAPMEQRRRSQPMALPLPAIEFNRHSFYLLTLVLRLAFFFGLLWIMHTCPCALVPGPAF